MVSTVKWGFELLLLYLNSLYGDVFILHATLNVVNSYYNLRADYFKSIAPITFALHGYCLPILYFQGLILCNLANRDCCCATSEHTLYKQEHHILAITQWTAILLTLWLLVTWVNVSFWTIQVFVAQCLMAHVDSWPVSLTMNHICSCLIVDHIMAIYVPCRIFLSKLMLYVA